jgi:hypothetical protein
LEAFLVEFWASNLEGALQTDPNKADAFYTGWEMPRDLITLFFFFLHFQPSCRLMYLLKMQLVLSRKLCESAIPVSSVGVGQYFSYMKTDGY